MTALHARLMRVVYLLLAASAAGVCRAGDSTDAWERIGIVTLGQRVRVETAAKKHTGEFIRFSSGALTFRTFDDQEMTVRRSEVTRLYAQTESHRLRNTIIGSLVGTAAGAVLYGTVGERFRNEGAGSGGLLAIPIGVGAAVGAALPAKGMKLVYKASIPKLR